MRAEKPRWREIATEFAEMSVAQHLRQEVTVADILTSLDSAASEYERARSVLHAHRAALSEIDRRAKTLARDFYEAVTRRGRVNGHEE